MDGGSIPLGLFMIYIAGLGSIKLPSNKYASNVDRHTITGKLFRAEIGSETENQKG